MANTFFNLPASAGNGSGAAVDVSTAGTYKTITVSGTFRGTVIVEFSNEGSSGPWAQLMAVTGPKTFTVPVAARFMRCTRFGVPTVSPGLPVVDVGSNDSGGNFTDLPTTAGNGTGASVDVSAFGTFNTVCCLGDFRGTVNIEISEDNTNWVTIMSFTAPGSYQSKVFTAQYMRVTRANVPTVAPGTANVDVGATNDAVGGGGTWTLIGPATSDPAPIDVGELIMVDPSGGGFAVTLPAIAAANEGQEITIKNITSSTNAVTVTADGTDTIDGAATYVMNAGFQSITIVSDGTGDWMIVANTEDVDVAIGTWALVSTTSDPAPIAFGTLVLCDPSGGAFAVTLPAIAAGNAGRQITIKNATSDTTAITVTPTGADTIDGAASYTMNIARLSITVVSDGSGNWEII